MRNRSSRDTPLASTRNNIEDLQNEQKENQGNSISRLTPDMDFGRQIASDRSNRSLTPRKSALGEVKEEPEEFYDVAKEKRRASKRQIRQRGRRESLKTPLMK